MTDMETKLTKQLEEAHRHLNEAWCKQKDLEIIIDKMNMELKTIKKYQVK
jgi:hypothetical protein